MRDIIPFQFNGQDIPAIRDDEGEPWWKAVDVDLAHQFPVSLQSDYGKWLTGYCAEHGIPVYKTAPADRRWATENTYHAGTIGQTLSGWLLRRSGQARSLFS